MLETPSDSLIKSRLALEAADGEYARLEVVHTVFSRQMVGFEAGFSFAVRLVVAAE
jgi:hypothetical protein